MKRFSIFCAVTLLAGVVIAATWGTSEGKILACTTAPKLLTFTTTLNRVTLENTDATNTVFALVNSTTNVLATRITAGTALPIPAGKSYTWDAQGNASIGSLTYATTNGSAEAVVQGY